MNYILVPSPKRKVNILGHDLYDLSNNIDYTYWVRTFSGNYIDVTQFKEDISHLEKSTDCFYLIELLYSIMYNDTTENCKRYINQIEDKDCINFATKVFNKYNRTDLIAILLDKKKDIDKSGDFEL